MVVLAQYKEDTTWAMRLEDECDVEVRVYQSANHRDPYFVENLGGEAAKYFTAIEDVYDDDEPPPYLLFLHAHETSWHNGVNATEYICSDVWRVIGGNNVGMMIRGVSHMVRGNILYISPRLVLSACYAEEAL